MPPLLLSHAPVELQAAIVNFIKDKLPEAKDAKPPPCRCLYSDCGGVLGLQAEAKAMPAPTTLDGAAVLVDAPKARAGQRPANAPLGFGYEG